MCTRKAQTFSQELLKYFRVVAIEHCQSPLGLRTSFVVNFTPIHQDLRDDSGYAMLPREQLVLSAYRLSGIG